MKDYEIVCLVYPELEEKSKEVITKLKGIINQSGGKILKENIWGLKKLAYPIRKKDSAFFVLFDFNLNTKDYFPLFEKLKSTENLMRFLIVKKEFKKEKGAKK